MLFSRKKSMTQAEVVMAIRNEWDESDGCIIRKRKISELFFRGPECFKSPHKSAGSWWVKSGDSLPEIGFLECTFRGKFHIRDEVPLRGICFRDCDLEGGISINAQPIKKDQNSLPWFYFANCTLQGGLVFKADKPGNVAIEQCDINGSLFLNLHPDSELSLSHATVKGDVVLEHGSTTHAVQLFLYFGQRLRIDEKILSAFLPQLCEMQNQ